MDCRIQKIFLFMLNLSHHHPPCQCKLSQIGGPAYKGLGDYIAEKMSYSHICDLNENKILFDSYKQLQ
jgi:hypothetical protein